MDLDVIFLVCDVFELEKCWKLEVSVPDYATDFPRVAIELQSITTFLGARIQWFMNHAVYEMFIHFRSMMLYCGELFPVFIK